MKPETSLLPADWAVPAVFRSRLGDSVGRQRVMESEGHLLVVLHAPPTADEAGRRGRFFWRDPQGHWRAAPKAERVASLEEHLEEFRAKIAELEQAAESAREARDYFELLDQLTPLARSARNLYETLQQARQLAPNDRRLIVARDDAYELARRGELLAEDARNGLDFAVAWQAEQQAESGYKMAVAAYRLNRLVAFFFPVATLMAIFGANLHHGLEGWDRLWAPLPLLAVLAAGLLAGIVLTGFVTRPARRPTRDDPRNSSSSPTRRSK